MQLRTSIERTKQCFEASFAAETYYNKQTGDDKHLELIINSLGVKAGMSILDLGTGTGYLAFPLAEKYPQAEVTGLDIVDKALEENRTKAENNGLKNIQFISYDGMDLPFNNESFDMVVTRYALHHFPEINSAFSEVRRVLKQNGLFFLSDPAPNDDDTERFVDAYMQMKMDGHNKFYTKCEWLQLGDLSGLSYIKGFESEIRFPKKKETAQDFDDIISRFDEDVIKGYGIDVTEDEIWITEKVKNLLFQKQ